MRKLIFASLLIGLGVASCVQEQALWQKPTATTDDFNKDKYSCMQQSQQRNSSAYVNRYGGYADSQVITNNNLFTACMNSQGWRLSKVSNIEAYNDTMRPIAGDIQRACAELSSGIGRKMTCKANETTTEQTLDRTKITASEKTIFLKYRSSIDDAYRKIAEVDRKFFIKDGEAMASTLELFGGLNDRMAAELSEGRITWGEYNRRRLETSKKYDESLKMALGG